MWLSVRKFYPIYFKYLLQKLHAQWSSKARYPVSTKRQNILLILSAGNFSKDPLTLIPNTCGCSDCFTVISVDLGSVTRYSD